jgi:putative tricarboxylic transport membrane protein
MQTKESSRGGGDAWLGIALLGTSFMVLVFSRSIKSIGLGDNFDPGPTAFPLGLSALLALGGLVDLWQSRINSPRPSTIDTRPSRPDTRQLPAIRSSKSEGGTPSSIPKTESKSKTVLLLLACFLLYVIILPWLGFSVSTLIMATVMMVLLGNSWKQSLIVSVIMISIIYLLFVILFKVPLPGGVFNLPF